MDTKEYARQIHAPARKPKEYAQVFANAPFDVLACDTMHMKWASDDAFAGRNSSPEYHYIALFIDVLTRRMFAYAMKTVTAAEFLECLKKAVAEAGMTPEHLWQDGGSEMKGPVKAYCTAHGIVQYSTYGGNFKVSIAERAIRTVRERLARHFDETQTLSWVSYLPTLVKDYNNTVHSAIKMTPMQAWEQPALAWQALYGSPRDAMEPKYAVGTWVRISRWKGQFEKGSYNWSTEPFEIERIKPGPAVRYYLRDLLGESLEGPFYGAELQVIDPEHPTERPTDFLVEKVLKTRVRKGVPESLIRWLGLDARHDSWEPTANITQEF